MTEERWGTDLQLLRDLEHQDSRSRGSDLATTERPETGQMDLARLDGLDNLRQALLLRFLTPSGELTPLGHPDYGTRLFELIGELNTERNRNRAKMYVLQALAQEPRVGEVLRVDVKPSPRDPARIDISVALHPLRSDSVLNLVFPFFLDRSGGQ